MGTLRQLRKSRRGMLTVLAAMLMILMVLMLAFAVDLGSFCSVQTQAQAVADSAALAGARGLTSGQAQVIALASGAAAKNAANGAMVSLQSGDIIPGIWSVGSGTFTACTTANMSSANACQVKLSLTAARSNAISTMFAGVVGVKTINMVATATAGVGRWDIVICCDRTSSFSQDLSQATSGMQTILSDLNSLSPNSNLGIVTFNGVGYINASLQPVGANYNTLNTAITSIQDCANGGPPCSGSDLAAGMATAIGLFSAAGYNPPLGTRKAIIFISDGAANIGSQCLNKNLTDAADNTLAATEAANAYSGSGISVFSLLYYHGSDDQTDISAMEALVHGQGTYIQEPNAAQLTSDIQFMLINNLAMKLVQ